MQLTSLNDITLTTTSKTIVNDKKAILPRLAALEILSGQKATWTKARKSIATFKLRKNMVVGCKVTLRKKVMFSFFEKLIIILLPRMRDYRGLMVKKKNFLRTTFSESLKTKAKNTITKAFFLETRKLLKEKNKTYNLGIQNLLINPELENYFEFFYSINGFSVTINNNAKKETQSNLILSAFQIPLII